MEASELEPVLQQNQDVKMKELVFIGHEADRWLFLRDVLKLDNNVDMATFLLDR